MYHDQTTRPLHDIRWELLTLLAHGAFVTMVDKTGFDGWLDPMAYDRIGVVFKEAHAKREHFGQTSVAEVGIYFSSRTRDWLGREQSPEYFQSFQGAHKAMVYEHIPWGIVLDENATLERLRQFPVLLLPHAAILSEREIALLRDYVQEGGNLILTGWTGMLGWRGEPREESALRELAGVHFVRRLEPLDNWVRFLNPNPRICITAPTTVEAIVTNDLAKRMLRVHLLGYNSPPQTTPPKDRPHILPGLIEDAPLYRATIEFDEPIKRATATNKSTKLTRHGRRLEVMVNDIHEIGILRY